MEASFYIPINSKSLADYFSKGIILPAKYFTNKPEDIQNSIADSILVSESKWVNNSDCSIEIILTRMEVKELIKLSEHFFLSDNPIPISRIKSVCFLDSRQKDITIWDINNGAAFIPESLVTVEDDNNIEMIPENTDNSRNEFKSGVALADKIKRFDIILGGFAFMRLGGKPFMNYSENYFSTLSYFNKLIEEQTINAAKEKGFKFSSKYTGLFSKNESEWTKWQQYIYQNLEPQDIELLAEKEDEKIEKRLGLLKIDSINPSSHLYELAILATYGDRKSKSTDNLVTDLTNGTILPEKIEDVSILFGLNNGYSKLRNKYKGPLKDSYVKFTLESKLDYYIIESIYQFVFNNSKPTFSFEYIDKWCPLSKLKDNVKGYETFKILDTVVIAKKKQTPLEIFFENYSPEIYSIIVKIMGQWLPTFTSTDEKAGSLYFESKLRTTLAASIEALQRKIENDCEANFNAQKQENAELYQKEVDKLRIEILNLEKENGRLKKGTNISEDKAASTEIIQKLDSSERRFEHEDKDKIRAIQERAISLSDDYDLMSLPELKAIAKKNRVKNYTKATNKEELINLIKTKPPLNF